MMERVFNVIFQPEPEGGFTAIVPSLPGCVTYGKTLEKAQVMVGEAVQGYLECLKKHGEPIPNDAPLLMASVRVPARLMRRPYARKQVRTIA